jgi:hypothetical protein
MCLTEKDRSVVGDKVPVSLLGLELDREPSRVSSEIARTGLSSDGGESDGDGAFGALLEQIGNTEVLEAIGAFPGTVSSRSFSVNDPLGNSTY